MIIELNEFKNYSNVFTDNIELQESYILSANNIINDYLGYDINEKILNPKTGELEDITEIPQIIKLTAMRIASILQMESDSNIAISSKYFAESGTRTFINTTDFFKYLVQISQYKLIRI